MSGLILRTLLETDEAAFMTGLKEWKEEDRGWFSFEFRDGISYKDHLKRLADNTNGKNLPEGRVSSTMLYGFVDGVIVGRISIRHQLTEQLKQYGGHLGYAVAEKYRRKGYGTEILKKGLEFCSFFNIDKALLTCDEKNIASIKIIEKLNGKLENTFWDETIKRNTRRYWIEVK